MHKSLKNANKILKFCICKHKIIKINEKSDCKCITNFIINKEKKIYEQKKRGIYCALENDYIKKNKFCNCLDKCAATLSELQLYNFE